MRNRLLLLFAVLLIACGQPAPAPSGLDASTQAPPHRFGTDYPANLLGDVTGAPGANTLSKIQGVSVPAATTGYLFFSAGAFSWNSGSSSVAGTAITGGTADQLIDENHAGTTSEWFTAGGDLTFASHNFTVVSISGSSPIAITPASLQWVKGTASPALTQAAPTTDVATTTLSITSQPAYSLAVTNKSAGTLALDTGASVAGGTSVVNVGASNAGAIGIGHTGVTTTVNGSLTQQNGAWSFTGNAASQATTTAGNTTIDSAAVLNLATSTATSIIEGNSSTVTALSQTVKSTGAITNVVGSTTVNFQGAASGDFSAYGTTPGSVGSIRCTGNTTCVGINGFGVLKTDGSNDVFLNSGGAPVFVSVNGTNSAEFAQTSSDFVDLGASGSQALLLPTGITWQAGVVSPTLQQSAASAAGNTPTSITIAPQAPNGSCNASGPCSPGSFIVNVAAAGATGSPSEAGLIVERAGSAVVAAGTYAGASTYGTIWLGADAATRAGSAWSIRANGASGSLAFGFGAANIAMYADTIPGNTGSQLGNSGSVWGNAFFGSASGATTFYEFATPAHNPDGTYPQKGQNVTFHDFVKMTTTALQVANQLFTIPAPGGSRPSTSAIFHYGINCGIDVAGTAPWNNTTGSAASLYSDCELQCSYNGTTATCATVLPKDCTSTSNLPTTGGSCLMTCAAPVLSGATVTLQYTPYNCASPPCAAMPTVSCQYYSTADFN